MRPWPLWAAALFALALVVWPSAPPAVPAFAAVQRDYRPSDAWLLDCAGVPLASRRVDFNVRRLQWLPLEQVSPALQAALVRAEDRRFWQHGGVDWLALATAVAALPRQALQGRPMRGASTLTMQLAGLLDPALAPGHARRSLSQKWRQMRMAWALEQGWSKRQILEAYLNLAPFRGELVGVHAASLALLGVHPAALDQPRSLLLAALLKGPQRDPAHWARRACSLAPDDAAAVLCPALAALARQRVQGGSAVPKEAALAPHLAVKLLREPGQRVTSTLDAGLQRLANRVLREQLLALDGRSVRDGAVVVLDNASGDVLAYVGSSGDLSAAPEVDGAVALRQAGSTLKPFLYGMALAQRRLTAASVMDDAPIQLDTLRGLYVPQNYDRDFKGPVSVRTALAASLNIPAILVLSQVGLEPFTEGLRAFGLSSLVESGDYYGFSLALGGAEVRLLELTNAYRALANGGIWRPAGMLPGDHTGGEKRVLAQAAAFVVADILSDRAARALTFGLENPLTTRAWSAVKTGTSKDMRDNWCLGFSRRYTVGVWVGNFSGEPMRDVSGISGAAPVWRELMDALHAEGDALPVVPKGLVRRTVHFVPEIESPRDEYFLSGTETAEVKLLARDERAGAAHILYPTDGTVIAIDPDIPPRHQRVRLVARGQRAVIWMLDGRRLGEGAEVVWHPEAGRHRLVLADAQGGALDRVTFEVRGEGSGEPAPDGDAAAEP